MSDINNVNLIGRLTKDPEMKYTQSGSAVTKLSIANNRKYKKNTETIEEVSYFDVTIFGKNAK